MYMYFFLSGPDFTYMNFRKDKKTLPPKSYFNFPRVKLSELCEKLDRSGAVPLLTPKYPTIGCQFHAE